MKIGILREGKVPADKRVALSPHQCITLLNIYPRLQIEVQASEDRCYSNEDYRSHGVTVKEDISGCDVFLGVKEVPIDYLIPNKTYMYFSHTIKKQNHNREMLRTILNRNIRLIDYEVLKAENGARLIGFGRYAGIVGAYNAFLTYGKKYQLYDLKPAHHCSSKLEMISELKKVNLPDIKIVLTGGGRVANGVLEILEELAIRRISVDDYLSKNFNEVCYVQLGPADYNAPKKGGDFNLKHFYSSPKEYKCNFLRFCAHTDLLISAAYWDPDAPVLFRSDDMLDANFKIKVIADISCDIDGAIPSTIRASSIDRPYYDYNPSSKEEEAAFSREENVTVMAVDNLPCELPKDASHEFGSHLINRVLEFIIKNDRQGLVKRATIAEDGQLTESFKYLQDWVDGA